jgi:hypothetical protein
MSHREIRIIDAMMEHGDAFTRGIASLYTVANPTQKAQVREAFRDTWDTYENISVEIENTLEPHP